MVIFYGQHGVDDAWTLSFDYYYLKTGFEFDRLFGNGHGVVAYFGKTHSFIYGLWAEVFGWGRLTHRLLSVLFVWIGVWLWSRVLLALGASRNQATIFILVCLLLDTFVSAAVKTRPEALVFVVGAAAVLCAVHGRWFWAALLTYVSIETHPAAAVYGLYIVAAWLSLNQWKNLAAWKHLLPRIIPATLLGIGYYLWLHGKHLPGLLDALGSGSEAENLSTKYYLIQHFLYAKLYRHIPDLLFFTLAYLIFYVKRVPQDTMWKFAHWATISIVISSLVLQRGNPYYAIHSYPVFLLVTIIAWQKMQFSLKYFAAFIILLMLPQYSYLAYKGWGFYFPDYIQQVRQHSKAANADIFLGHSAHWFAFNQDKRNAMRFYAAANAFAPIADTSFLWVRDSIWETINGGASHQLQTLSQDCPMQLLSSFKYVNHTVRFEQYDCREAAQNKNN